MLVSTDDKVIDSYEGIKLWLSNGKFIGTILEDINVIKVRIDNGTKLGSLFGSFDGSNDGNLEGIFLGGSLLFYDGKVFGSDDGIKLGLSDINMLCTILGNVDLIIFGIDIGTDLGSLDGSFWRFLWWKAGGIIAWRLTGIYW